MGRLIIRYIRHLKDSFTRVIDLPDSPRKIALGSALGAAMDFLPIPIISIPFSFILAKVIRVNAAAAVITVLFFKLGVPFFFFLNCYTGQLLIQEPVEVKFSSFESQSISTWISYLESLGRAFLVGAAANSAMAAVLIYFSVRALLEYRLKKHRKR